MALMKKQLHYSLEEKIKFLDIADLIEECMDENLKIKAIWSLQLITL